MREPVIFLDTETGGLDPRASGILSVGLITLNLQGALENPRYFIVHPPTSSSVSPEALKKNGLDLVKHMSDPKGISYERMKAELLSYYQQTQSRFGVKKIKFGGHNIRYDIEMLIYQLFEGKWPKEFPLPSHCIDTMQLVSAVAAARLDISRLNLESCLSAYDLENPIAHNAYHDAVSSAKLYKKIMKV